MEQIPSTGIAYVVKVSHNMVCGLQFYQEYGVGEFHHSFFELHFSKDKLQKVAGAEDETSFVY